MTAVAKPGALALGPAGERLLRRAMNLGALVEVIKDRGDRTETRIQKQRDVRNDALDELRKHIIDGHDAKITHQLEALERSPREVALRVRPESDPEICNVYLDYPDDPLRGGLESSLRSAIEAAFNQLPKR